MPGFAQLVHDPLHLGVHIVIGVGVHKADIRAIDAVKDLVAAGQLAPFFQDENRLHTELCGTRGSEHGMVRLRATCGEHHIGAVRLCIRQQELQLAHLVSAERHTDHVVSLDVNVLSILPADRLQLVKRRRQHSEGNARELCDLFHEQNLLSAGDCLNLHQSVLRQSRDLNSAARRSILRKESGVHLVHGREVVHIAEKNGGLDDIFHRKSRLRQNSLNIGQGLTGLLCDAAGSEATGRGVYGQLPGCDDQITGADSL